MWCITKYIDIIILAKSHFDWLIINKNETLGLFCSITPMLTFSKWIFLFQTIHMDLHRFALIYVLSKYKSITFTRSRLGIYTSV